MHDIRAIRADATAFDAALARRGMSPVSPEILALDTRRRELETQIQRERAQANTVSKMIGAALREGRKDEADRLRSELGRNWDETLKAELVDLDLKLKSLLESLPNVLDADVPDGPDESANVVLHQVGEPRDLGFQPKQHFELGEALGMMDFATAAKLAGARFTVLRGPLARLERALGQFMIDLHTTQHGYTEMVVPSLVNDATLYGTAQLPKFAEDNFRTTDGRWLIPTAEVPLTNSVGGEILAEKALPLRLTALTDCYRSEAGAAGRDTRGMLRQHQFRKVEMVSIAH
ncbi:MAG: serine--tRNA ligase, partial [Rhodospirillales bacterium]|nr:serine--tRNA ligase [Rhodospirillales bacterium]